MTRNLAIATVIASSLPILAAASSDEAWAEFRTAVEESCRTLVEGVEGEAADAAEIEVNPFGSEHFGAAIVTIPGADGAGDRMVCIYDKQTGAAEITGPFLPEGEADPDLI